MGDRVTLYNRRIIGIVAANLVPIVDAKIFGLLGDGHEKNLTIPLSPSGDEPATHYASDGQMTEAQHDAVASLADPSAGVHGFPGWADGVDDDSTAVLVTDPENMPVPTGEQRVVWRFDAAISSLGLQRIVPKMPGVSE